MTVAARFKRNNLRVIDGLRFPIHRRVARFTRIGRTNMAAWFAGRRRAGVATRAIINDAGMVERHHRPTIDVMTSTAFLRCLHVIGAFAYRRFSVVATAADTFNLRMIHRYRTERMSALVASLTTIRRGNVTSGLSYHTRSVVTAYAITNNAAVIKLY